MDAGYANLEGAYVILETPILKAHTSQTSIVLFLPTDGRLAVRYCSQCQRRSQLCEEESSFSALNVDPLIQCWT
jgi:hypothetical protein